jgi:hypothetical protein
MAAGDSLADALGEGLEEPVIKPKESDWHVARWGAEEDKPFDFIPPLTALSLRIVAANFTSRPTFAGIPKKFQEKYTELLPTNLALEITAPLIENESYWKRCALEKYENCPIAEHGLSWKQLFFEKVVEQDLENFDAANMDIDVLKRMVQLSKDYVHKLKVRQFGSQADLSFLFDNLPHLSALSMTYGARNVGMDYERSLFGMKLTDAASLARELRKNESLTSLTLSCNLIDDEKARTLVLGLMENHTITSLDLSHNKIADRGVRALCKLLSEDSVITTLNLCDNHVHSEGGKFIGRALQINQSLIQLNLRLNRLGEKGGCYVCEGMKSNHTLKMLNLSSNGLEVEASRLFCGMAKINQTLREVDFSSNGLGPEGAKSIREGLEHNKSIVFLDVRQNQINPEVERLIDECLRANEVRQRKAAALAAAKAGKVEPP